MMRIVENLEGIKKSEKPVVLAAGFFDGVHKGHQKVLETAKAKASAHGGHAWVLTFSVHPMKVLKIRKQPPLITSNEHKLRIFEEMGLEGCIVYPFRKSTSQLSPRDFLLSLKDGIGPLTEIVVGRNWKFGKGGEGTTRVLSVLCRDMGIKLDVVNPVMRDGGAVSSTRIRAHILRGEFRAAEKMLGRPVSVLGRVVKGKRMATGLGFPTANIDSEDEVLPPFGVYAVMVYLDRKTYPGIMNFGIRPTFARGSVARPVMEVHVMDFSGDLYGRQMEIYFVEKLRDEKRFPCKEDLRTQIDLDVRLARAVLGV